MLHRGFDGGGDGVAHARDGSLNELDIARVGAAEGATAGEREGLLHFQGLRAKS